MKLTENQKLIYELRSQGKSVEEIGTRLDKSCASVLSTYKKVLWIRQKEKEVEIARLNIYPKTFEKIYNIACQYNLFLFDIDLLTIDGIVKAINNNKLRDFNKSMSRYIFTDKMINELIRALEEIGYTINQDQFIISKTYSPGIHFISDPIYNNDEIIIKFNILNIDGILTCECDGTNPKVYLSKHCKYSYKSISDQIITIIKKEGII